MSAIYLTTGTAMKTSSKQTRKTKIWVNIVKCKSLIPLLLFCFSSNIFAEKVYMGIVKNETDYSALVTLIDRQCSNPEGNAMYVSGKNGGVGCWTADGDKVKLEIFENGKTLYFDKNIFSLINDTNDKSSINDVKRQNTKVILNCIADAWIGDVDVERDASGALVKVVINGEVVTAIEKSNAINFAYNKMDISLSTLTGMFSYETSTIFKLLSANVRRGTGRCNLVQNVKKF